MQYTPDTELNLGRLTKMVGVMLMEEENHNGSTNDVLSVEQ